MSDSSQLLAVQDTAAINEPQRSELRKQLSQSGIEAAELAWLTPPSKRGRATLWIETPERVALKVRLLESEAEAARLADLHDSASLTFLPLVAQHGRFLVEEWVSGMALQPDQAEARVEEVGALLGRLHATPLTGVAARIDTQEHRERAEGCLAQLGASGDLDDETLARLCDVVASEAPSDAPAALIHHDFAPDNIVVDGDGALHLIDTEWLNIGAVGADLGRTAARWPMAAETWQLFLHGYASASPHAPEALRFWQIALAARTAIIRKDAEPEIRRPVLARLSRLAESDFSE